MEKATSFGLYKSTSFSPLEGSMYAYILIEFCCKLIKNNSTYLFWILWLEGSTNFNNWYNLGCQDVSLWKFEQIFYLFNFIFFWGGDLLIIYSHICIYNIVWDHQNLLAGASQNCKYVYPKVGQCELLLVFIIVNFFSLIQRGLFKNCQLMHLWPLGELFPK